MSERTILDRLLGRKVLYKENGIIFASFNDRLFANVIDLVIIYLLLAPLLQVFNTMIYGDVNPIARFFAVGEIAQTDDAQARAMLSALFIDWILVCTVQLLMLGAPFLLCWRYFQATPGKMLLGLKIMDKKTLQPATFNTYVTRYFAFFISLPVFMLGFVWLVFSKRKQSWHDHIAGTVVIHTEYSYLVCIIRMWSWTKNKIKTALGMPTSQVQDGGSMQEKENSQKNTGNDPLDQYKNQ